MGIHFGGDGWEYWYKTIDDVMQDAQAVMSDPVEIREIWILILLRHMYSLDLMIMSQNRM